jgi:ABC-type enterobactin transport system permease subunit
LGAAQRTLSEPRLLLAFSIGALIGLPGAAYLTALHNLIAGHYSTATLASQAGDTVGH